MKQCRYLEIWSFNLDYLEEVFTLIKLKTVVFHWNYYESNSYDHNL